MNWAFVILGVCATTLGIGRLLRLRDEPTTLTQKSIVISLFSIGVGAAAYGTRFFTAPFHDIGNTIWHMAATVLIGALETVFLTLRVKEVQPRTVRGIVARSGLMTLLLLIAWPIGQADGGLTHGVDSWREHDLASLASLVVFPLYIIWGLSQIVMLSLYRVPHDIRRRPINTLALALVSAGALGFICINVAVAVYLNTGRTTDSGMILAYSPIALGVCVAGAGLLAVGEHAYEEFYALYQIARLKPLWKRLDQLSQREFHLGTRNLSAPARLQRAYVEVSDAICTLRIDVGERPDIHSAAASLHRGGVMDNEGVLTLSQSLPERKTRREDLEMIHELAREYRRQ